MGIEEKPEDKGLDFGGANIPKLFKLLFFPTLAAMVCDALFIIVDGMFVGHGAGATNSALNNKI